MPPPRLPTPIVYVAMALCIGGAIFVAWPAKQPSSASPHLPDEPAPPVTQSATSLPLSDLARTTSALAPAPHNESIASLVPDDPGPPRQIALRQVFPDLAAPPGNWRQFRPETLTVSPHPDLPVTFTRTVVKDEGKYVTWIGRNAALPGASFVGVATAAGYDAILVLPGASQFSFHIRGDEVVVAETVPGEDSCGNDPAQPAKTSLPEPGAIAYGISYAPGFEQPSDTHAEAAPLKVDVLFAYDADTLAAASGKSSDPVGYIDGQSKAMLETCNLALSQSLVTAFSWRYLGAVAAPAYPRTGKLQDDINAMKPDGAIGDWTKSTRYQRGADQITLLIGGTNDWGGIASSEKQVAVPANFSNSALKWGYSYKLLAHELAHNFGCKHDRAHYEVSVEADPGGPVTPAPDGDGFWCYGEMWSNPAIPGGADSGTSGTIMSYADYPIPYFSNPHIEVHVTGSLAGWSWNPDLGTHRVGRVETDPKAAYNVKVLNEQASAMSKLTEEVIPPAISQQPKSVTVTRGQSLTLSVSATGGGLSYQWLKGGNPIASATTALFSKTAEAMDAGEYAVKVSNFAGSVTSEPAIVTINVPPVAPGGLTATATSPSQINLAWTDNSNDETAFKVERATAADGPWTEIAGTLAANTTAYSATSLSASTTYHFRVRATNTAGDSAYTATASATTLTAPPAAPGGLTATAASSSQINLAWSDNSNDETAFKVERATAADGPWTEIAGTLAANTTAYSATSLSASTTYHFRVRATNAAGDSAYTATASATTSAASNPNPPPSSGGGGGGGGGAPSLWFYGALALALLVRFALPRRA